MPKVLNIRVEPCYLMSVLHHIEVIEKSRHVILKYLEEQTTRCNRIGQIVCNPMVASYLLKNKTFYTNSAPILRLEKFASKEASSDYAL